MPFLITTEAWWVALGIGFGGLAGATVLLILLVVVAYQIDRHALDIWEAGKNIAANTVSIWMLERTNDVAGEILTAAQSINAAAESMDTKLGALNEALRRRGS